MKRLYDVTAVFSETIVRKRSHNVLSRRHYRRFHSNAISFRLYIVVTTRLETFSKRDWIKFSEKSSKRLYDVTGTLIKIIIIKRSNNIPSRTP